MAKITIEADDLWPLEQLVGASVEAYGDDWEDDDDADVAFPPSGITFGMMRRASEALRRFRELAEAA